MEKIDRLGWAAGISFVSYGLRIGIRVNNRDVMARLPDILPPHTKPARSPKVARLYSLVVGGAGPRSSVRRFNVLYADAARVARTVELETAVDALESDLQLYVADRAHRRLFVHAGVVGWRGRAIIIPGRSFTGKSTLVAALVRAGATYYSDEYAVFDAQGRVHPYPKPLSIRGETGAGFRRFRPVELSGLPGDNPLPAGLVVVTSYRAGAQWRPRRLSPGRAVLALLANTVSARRHPQLALTTLPRIVSQALLLNSVRGEAEELVDSLLNKAERAPIVLTKNGRARVAAYGGERVAAVAGAATDRR
ncbi:MAG: hypothetical protein ACE5NC_09290 [Anaerolineae bacterium]